MADNDLITSFEGSGLEAEIVRELTGIPDDIPISITRRATSRERFGSPFSRFIRGAISFRRGNEDSTLPEETTTFYLQYSNGDAVTQTPEQDTNLKYGVYEIFHDSEITPVPYRVEGIPRGILLSVKGDTMLEEKLAGLPIEERAKLNQTAGEVLLAFHLYAGSVMPRIIAKDNVSQAIKTAGNRPAIEKALKCFGDFYAHKNGEPPSDDTVEEFVQRYGSFIGQLDRYHKQVIHGDAGAQNFIGFRENKIWTPENTSIIDLTNLRFGHAVMDLAKLATSHNMLLSAEQWREGIENYYRKQASQSFELKKKPFLGIGGEKEIELPPFKEDFLREVYRIFNRTAVQTSLKRMGYMARLALSSPSKYDVWVFERPALAYTYDEMGRNMRVALDDVRRTEGKYQPEGEMLAVDGLARFFENEGIIPPKDTLHTLEERCKKAYANSPQ